MTLVASLQMASGPNVTANLYESERLIDQAASRGARLIVLPENFAIMGIKETDMVDAKEADGSGPIQDFLTQMAKKHAVWLVGGTIPLEADSPDKVRSACLLLNDRGERVARYDKIHLFDVQIGDDSEKYTESKTIEPGNEIVVADTPFGRMGLAVCYDLRFPELFRAMLDQGMELIVVPSAFTAFTGKAHWECLVRARAVENLCYVIAAAQGGFHINGRETHGNAMIVDPWGNILERLISGAGIVIADIDTEHVSSTRRNFPSIEHRRFRCS